MHAKLASLKYNHILLILILVAGAFFAYGKEFLQDDAYISFRYARHFAEGHGLVWYPGSNEYGYTNFLFTLLIGLMMKVGLAPETASYLISVPSFFLAIIFTYGIGRLIFSSLAPTLLACMAIATNHTMAAYATGGLETSFQICLVLATYYYVLRWHQSGYKTYLKRTALCASLALLTRFDSALLLFPAYAFMGIRLLDDYRRREITIPDMIKKLAIAAGIPTLAVCSLLIFCYYYYNGYAMPTSFYAKIDDKWYIYNGLQYVFAFIKAQAYIPLVLIGIWVLMVSEKDFSWHAWRYRSVLLGAIVLWLGYILHVGGDFMEFRFILPILPFFYLLVFDLIIETGRRKNIFVIAVLAGLTFFGNYIQPHYFASLWMDKNLIESTGLLNKWVSGEPYNWTRAGKELRKSFNTGSPDDVKIAVTGAGIIPYYSGLNTIDQHGLNTRKVIEAGGEEYQPRPGHRVKAKISFLQKAGVNLIIDHPIFLKKKKETYYCLPASIFITHASLMKVPVIFIPMEEPYYLLAHYLVEHPQVEAMVRDGKIVYYQDVAEFTKCDKKFEIEAES